MCAVYDYVLTWTPTVALFVTDMLAVFSAISEAE